MSSLTHKSPSVGSVIKKLMAINPHLSAHEMIGIIKQSIDPLGGHAGEFSSAEVIDEAKAIRLAQASLPNDQHP